jgi:hypothetical protein
MMTEPAAYVLIQSSWGHPAVRARVTARQMQRLLDAGDDRAAVLSRSVGVLSDDDERLLIDLLRHTEDGDR